MLLYYGRRYDAASVGARVVGVVCEKCGCEYFYELARVGAGAASAPYAIGSAGAERSAKQQARKDLDRRLTEEAELVPCPKCRWINEELVAGHRRGRYRGATTLAVGLGVVGILASLAGAWFVSLGPAADRGALPYFLIGGPAVSIALAAAVLLLRYLLRARIRPNRHHPQPPRLPHGSPAALVPNRANGQLEPADPAPEPGGRAGAWIDFQVGRNSLPPICCQCLASAAPGSEYRRPVRPAVDLVVPLCAPCAHRWTRHLWLGALAALALTAGVGLPALLLIKLDEIVFWMAVVGLGIVAPVVGSMVAGRMAEPVRVKVVDSSRGVVRLWFRNEDVSKRVAADGPTRAG
jgi:hypothetical protein